MCVVESDTAGDNLATVVVAARGAMTNDEISPDAQILLCDDSSTERIALAALLRSVGYGVEEASDGDAAIVKLKHRSVDLVLLDLQMPQVDGFAVLSYLQEHRRALPVILLSGMPLHKIQHRISSLPTPELPPLLLKPINPDQLLGVVDLQLSGQFPQLHADGANVPIAD